MDAMQTISAGPTGTAGHFLFSYIIQSHRHGVTNSPPASIPLAHPISCVHSGQSPQPGQTHPTISRSAPDRLSRGRSRVCWSRYLVPDARRRTSSSSCELERRAGYGHHKGEFLPETQSGQFRESRDSKRWGQAELGVSSGWDGQGR